MIPTYAYIVVMLGIIGFGRATSPRFSRLPDGSQWSRGLRRSASS
jgi:hypothetical protein